LKPPLGAALGRWSRFLIVLVPAGLEIGRGVGLHLVKPGTDQPEFIKNGS
jgi:hypothetical protein